MFWWYSPDFLTCYVQQTVRRANCAQFTYRLFLFSASTFTVACKIFKVVMNVQLALTASVQLDKQYSDELSSESSDVQASDDEDYSDDSDSGNGSGWRSWLAGDNDFAHYPFTAQNVGPHFSSAPASELECFQNSSATTCWMNSSLQPMLPRPLNWLAKHLVEDLPGKDGQTWHFEKWKLTSEWCSIWRWQKNATWRIISV